MKLAIFSLFATIALCAGKDKYLINEYTTATQVADPTTITDIAPPAAIPVDYIHGGYEEDLNEDYVHGDPFSPSLRRYLSGRRFRNID